MKSSVIFKASVFIVQNNDSTTSKAVSIAIIVRFIVELLMLPLVAADIFSLPFCATFKLCLPSKFVFFFSNIKKPPYFTEIAAIIRSCFSLVLLYSGMQFVYRKNTFRSYDNSPFARHLTHTNLLCKNNISSHAFFVNTPIFLLTLIIQTKHIRSSRFSLLHTPCVVL